MGIEYMEGMKKLYPDLHTDISLFFMHFTCSWWANPAWPKGSKSRGFSSMKHPIFNNNNSSYQASRLQRATRFVFEQNRFSFSFEVLTPNLS